jgi:hypothetical protein
LLQAAGILDSWQNRLSDEEKNSKKKDDEQVRDHGDIPPGLIPYRRNGSTLVHSSLKN